MKLSAKFIEKLMFEFEQVARDEGYRTAKASKPCLNNKYYESDIANHAFIGFCLAHV